MDIDKDIPDKLSEFCTRYVKTEKGEPFSFEGRQFLYDILDDDNDLIYVIKGRQVGASTIFAADILHKALKYPRTTHIYMTDTQPHARLFSKYRFALMLHDLGLNITTNDNISKKPKDELVFEYLLPNKSLILMQSNYGQFTQSRSIPTDFIWLDECQSAELDQIGNLHSAMSRSKHGRMVMAGTTNMQGSVWERKWHNSTMCEWDGNSSSGGGGSSSSGTWNPHNKSADISGYLITQLMMPDMTESKIAKMRALYSPQEWDTEVMGIFTTGLAQPLTISEARLCYYATDMPILSTRIDRSKGDIIATMDLAGGTSDEAAYTVLTILQYHPQDDMVDVLTSYKYRESRIAPLMDKLSQVLDEYVPDRIISDAGGNQPLLAELESKYDLHKYASSGSLDVIKYGEQNQDVIGKSPMMARTIDRWHNQKIRVPDCADMMPWTIEHVTAEKAETITPKSGTTPYTRYERMPHRNDDFLQTLMFAESCIYAMSDPNNPHNVRTISFAQYDPRGDME